MCALGAIRGNHRLTGSQAHRLTGSQAHRLTGSQAHRLTGSQAHRLTGSQAHRLTGSHHLYLDHYVARSLRHLLLIIKYISAFVFILSFQCHRRFSSQVADWSTAEAYFIKFLMESSSNNALSAIYTSYRYHSVNTDESNVVNGTMLGHKMLAGFFLLIEDLPPKAFASNHVFCSILAFPEVMKAANIGDMSDSDYSMIVLAISAFSWWIYVALLLGRFLLEKRLLQVVTPEKLMRAPRHRRSVAAKRLAPMVKEHSYGIALAICSLATITIFGVYALKKTKSEEDSFWVCVWEVMKIAFMCFHKEISIKTK